MTTINKGVVSYDEPYVKFSYHPLQTLDVCVQNSSPGAPWLIYIHGGAWRDPKVTKSTGYPLIRRQLLCNHFLNAASINYRLSSHPSYPNEDNHAAHPDHLNDVVSALLYLKASYGLAERRYILVGHSAGATLAFQSLPMLYDHCLLPSAVIGAEGIYDLIDLAAEYPDYTGFISGAFGEDKEAWKDASPTWIGRRSGYAEYKGKVILMHSDDDELLSWRQTQKFREVIDECRMGRKARVVRAKGKHDQVPEENELVEVVSSLVLGLTKGKEVERAVERHML